MQPRRIIESVTTSEGTELVLIERGGTFLLEIDGEVLMSNLTYGSEEALAPKGVLGLWSASDDRVFRRTMEHAGFKLEVVQARARSMGRGRRHVIFLGRG